MCVYLYTRVCVCMCVWYLFYDLLTTSKLCQLISVEAPYNLSITQTKFFASQYTVSLCHCVCYRAARHCFCSWPPSCSWSSCLCCPVSSSVTQSSACSAQSETLFPLPLLPQWPSGPGVPLERGRSRVWIPLAPGFFWVESYQWPKNWHSSGYPARHLAL